MREVEGYGGRGSAVCHSHFRCCCRPSRGSHNHRVVLMNNPARRRLTYHSPSRPRRSPTIGLQSQTRWQSMTTVYVTHSIGGPRHPLPVLFQYTARVDGITGQDGYRTALFHRLKAGCSKFRAVWRYDTLRASCIRNEVRAAPGSAGDTGPSAERRSDIR